VQCTEQRREILLGVGARARGIDSSRETGRGREQRLRTLTKGEGLVLLTSSIR